MPGSISAEQVAAAVDAAAKLPPAPAFAEPTFTTPATNKTAAVEEDDAKDPTETAAPAVETSS
jgi:hypothetical protein